MPDRRRVTLPVVLVALLAAVALALGMCRAGYLVPFLPTAAPDADDLESIRLPDGFAISIFARVEGARSLCAGEGGVVFAGSRDAGTVSAVLDPDRDGQADGVVVIDEGLTQPNGVAYADGDLYVAEISRILRYEDVLERLDDPGPPAVVRDDLPDDEHHGWKFIAFGPDGRLYVPVGAPCNVCEEPLPYAAILRFPLDAGGDAGALETVARGVRNTVGFDWHPETGELWFTDNGRDWMGDERPPDELNHAPEPGLHFGFPYCHGTSIRDPEYGGRPCGEFQPPALELGPHVAALGMRFSHGGGFPGRYGEGVFIAEHGSWNRTDPIGYRVQFVPFEDGRPAGYETFAEGWLEDGAAWGRPVDVLVRGDGTLLVSDDKGGAIYRITTTR